MHGVAYQEGGVRIKMRQRMIKRAKELIKYKTVYYVVREDGRRDFRFKGQLHKTDKLIDVFKPRIGAWCW